MFTLAFAADTFGRSALELALLLSSNLDIGEYSIPPFRVAKWPILVKPTATNAESVSTSLGTFQVNGTCGMRLAAVSIVAAGAVLPLGLWRRANDQW